MEYGMIISNLQDAISEGIKHSQNQANKQLDIQ
jgi:hypothetical protein